MNAIILRELKKKEKTEGLSLASKKQATPATMTNKKGSSHHLSKKPNAPPSIMKKNIGSSSTISRLISPVSPTRKYNSPPPSPVQSSPRAVKKNTYTCPTISIQQKGKRKISTTSITSISSQETSGSESEHPSGPSIYHMYTPDTVIVGRGPNNIAQNLMLQLPSQVDANFISSLGWSDLARRTCSSLTEGIMYLGGLVERADLLKSAYHDLKEDNTIHNQLQTMLEEAKMAHAKDLMESKTQSDELLKKKDELLKQKDEEFHRLQEKHTTELQILREKLKVSQFEASQACKGLKDAKTQFMKESSSFKEEFLKSDEFNEVCGPRAFRYLETGFEGTVNLFKAHGYPPEGASTDFINLTDLVASLPPDL